MKAISHTDLLLTSEGRIYHLNLVPEEVADTIILVGDPDRVKNVSINFDKILTEVRNREFLTHSGMIGNQHITVLSTGIGPDNIDIVMNELDALANIDFRTRLPKPLRKSLRIIRIGTTGVIQKDMHPGDFIMSSHGLGLDGILYFYKDANRVIDHELTNLFLRTTNWPEDLPRPYIVSASTELLNKMENSFLQGITATAPGFYGPQGREILLELAYPELNEKLSNFRWKDVRVINYEMESAPLFGISKMLGHEALTICLVVANRPLKTFLEDYKGLMDVLIRTILEKIVS